MNVGLLQKSKRFFFILHSSFFIFFFILHSSFFTAQPAQAQIVPTPGSSCEALATEQERLECRKTICPRECLKAGLYQGGLIWPGTAPPTPTCAENEYRYSYCTFGKCIYEEEEGKGPLQNIQPNDPRLESALPCNYTLEDLVGAGVRLAMFIFGVAGSLAFLFFVYGGYQMVIALGNPEAINAAKKTLTGAVIGLIIILSAGLFVRFIGGLILPQGGEEISPGLIIPVGSNCNSDAQCGAGMTCSGGVCKTRCEVGRGTQGYFCQALACTENLDCDPGRTGSKVCFRGGCLTVAEKAARLAAGERELECEVGLCPGGVLNRCCK